jgi:Uma2 family endonuclease
MPVTAETYRRIALEDPEGQWELHHGRLREKPAMSFRHNDSMAELGFQIRPQLDPKQYRLRVNAGRVKRTDESYYIPDVMVFPTSLAKEFRDRPDVLEVYEAPLPFVAEGWSPSTGDYDVDSKLPEYQRRGDFEIWRLHPFERTVTAWRRRPDGTYDELQFAGGKIQLHALPNVVVDLDALFTTVDR